MRSLRPGGLATPNALKPAAAALVLLAVFVWVHRVSWPFSRDGPYALEGDGARYVQMAIQRTAFHRLGNMPEFGRDLSRIYPPLLPACIAVASLATGEYYYSAHATEAAALLLAVLAALVLGRLLSQSWFSAVCAGVAAAFFLVPRNAGMVLTEPLHALTLLGCLGAAVVWFRRAPDAGRAWVWVAAIFAAAATLSRPVGAALIPSVVAGLFCTLSRDDLRQRRYGLTVIGCGWLGGIVLYVAYQSYMESLGGIPLHTLLHAYTALLERAGSFWPVYRFDAHSGLVSLTPDAYSLGRMFRADPAAYLTTAWTAFKCVLGQWFMVLFAVHVIRILRACALGRLRRNPVSFCDISLATLFVLNTGILCLLAQHPLFIPRMYDPWVVCSLAVLGARATEGLGRLARVPGARAGLAFVLILAVAGLYPEIRAGVAETAIEHRQSGVIARNVIDRIRELVPAGQVVIGSPQGGPDIAVTIAGYPNMQFAGSPETFRTQMRAHGVRFALIAPQVTPNANAAMADCNVLFDYPFNRLFLCPVAPGSGAAENSR